MKQIKKILCVGATAGIAQSTLRLFAKDAASFILIGRDEEKLLAMAGDLKVRGAIEVEIYAWNFAQPQRFEKEFLSLLEKSNDLDMAMVAHGSLTNQKEAQQDAFYALDEVFTNFASHVFFLTHIANYFEQKKSGLIAVIASVAGDRGRQSNYLYGSCKSALDSFLQGLRNRLFRANVRVLTIKPGYVDSPMTAHMKKNVLFASSDYVGQCIYKKIYSNADSFYVPFFWQWIMLIIKLIPEPLFKRLKL